MKPDPKTEAAVQEIAQLIQQHDHIVIFHHIRPDGDCLGSQFGLGQLIRDNFPNKKIILVGDSKQSFSFLNFKHHSLPSDEFLASALAIVVDANYKDRIEKRELLDKNLFKTVLRIDHHPNDDDLGPNTIRWVDASFIAAAEQIAAFAYYSKWNLTAKAAQYMYLGIYTDSGRFLYNNTSARTFYLSAFLIEHGVNIGYLHNRLTQNSFNSLKYQGFVLNNFQHQDKVVYFAIDLETQKQLGLSPAAAVRPNYLANISGFPIWVFFSQEADLRWRVEYRSNGPSVRNVAIKHGGGGHLMASGSIANSEAEFAQIIADCNQEIIAWETEQNKR
ncbi:DHH family phosphoesterase [Candidatus Mycoplasma pogonae]